MHPAGSALKRVVLIGAESTGKTTLAERLAHHYGTFWLPEYVRAFVDVRGTLPETHDLDVIARGHLEREAALLPRANRLLIYDTDLISTCIYGRYYHGGCPAWVEQASYEHQADLYLLTGDDIPWQADPGQRDGPAVRAALQRIFREELARRGVPYVPVYGTLDERMRTAVAAIDRLLDLSPA